MFDGILLVDKPKGWTSFDVVAKTRSVLTKEKRALHNSRGFCMEMAGKDGASIVVNGTEEYNERETEQADAGGRSKESGVIRSPKEQAFRCKCRVKVGHAGTLDPLATGLMIILVGSYCKRASEFSKLDKVYEVEMKLGETSTTGDEEGQKTKVSGKKPSENEIRETLKPFLGKSKQTPPAYSAVKVGGQRAYKLAREGKEVKLEPRQIEIFDIKLQSYEYPLVKFTAHVGSGTYIRTLVEDLGKKMGTGAYTTFLKRTSVGDFLLAKAIKTDEIRPKLIRKH